LLCFANALSLLEKEKLYLTLFFSGVRVGNIFDYFIDGHVIDLITSLFGAFSSVFKLPISPFVVVVSESFIDYAIKKNAPLRKRI